MRYNSKTLPESIRRCMPQEQRAELNQLTIGEVDAAIAEQSERELQNQIYVWLTQHKGIDPRTICHPVFGKRTQLVPGWPDFHFCYKGRAVYIECKTSTGKLTHEQVDVLASLERNMGVVRVVTSLQEVRELLEEIENPHESNILESCDLCGDPKPKDELQFTGTQILCRKHREESK